VKNQKGILIFLVKFFVIFLVLSMIIEFANLLFLREFITFISASYLSLPFSGTTILVGSSKFLVSATCTGLVSSAILVALLFSSKKPTSGQKIFLAIFGVCLLLLLNIPRVMLVLVSAKVGFDADLVHSITWFIMSAFVIVIWYYGNKAIGVKDFSKFI